MPGSGAFYFSFIYSCRGDSTYHLQRVEGEPKRLYRIGYNLAFFAYLSVLICITAAEGGGGTAEGGEGTAVRG